MAGFSLVKQAQASLGGGQYIVAYRASFLDPLITHWRASELIILVKQHHFPHNYDIEGGTAPFLPP